MLEKLVLKSRAQLHLSECSQLKAVEGKIQLAYIMVRSLLLFHIKKEVKKKRSLEVRALGGLVNSVDQYNHQGP